MSKNWKAPKDRTFENAIIKEIDNPGQGCHYEKSILGGSIRWSPVTGKFILVNQVAKRHISIPAGKKGWWAKFGDQAREYARQHHLPGPHLQDVAPEITPGLINVTQWTEDDPNEQEIRSLIVEQILAELLAEGRIVKHPSMNLYKRVW